MPAPLGQQYDRMRRTIVPEEFRERRPQPRRMPDVPQQARGARDRTQGQGQGGGQMALANRLLAKLIPGSAAAKGDIIPYGRLPEAFRGQVKMSGPAVGFDPMAKEGPYALEPDERALLFQLLQRGATQTESSPADLARAKRRMLAQERAQKIEELKAAQARPWVQSSEWRKM